MPKSATFKPETNDPKKENGRILVSAEGIVIDLRSIKSSVYVPIAFPQQENYTNDIGRVFCFLNRRSDGGYEPQTSLLSKQEVFAMPDDIIQSDPQPRQLSLFDTIFDSRIRRHTEDNRVHFSILDIFQYYGKAKNPTTSWKTVLKFLEKQGFDQSREILDWRPDGKKGGKPTPTATLDVILRIAQVTEFKEWETLRRWMAETAHERIEEIADPELGVKRAYERARKAYHNQGKSEDWIADRFKTIDDYKLLCNAIDKVCANPQYGVIVNSEYVTLFGMVASKLKVLLKANSIRDALPELQLAHLHADEVSLRLLLDHSDSMTTNAICDAARSICMPLAESLTSVSAAIGVHYITGQPLIGGAR